MSDKTTITESKKPKEPEFTVVRGKIPAELMAKLQGTDAEVLLKANGFDKLIDGAQKAKKQEETQINLSYDFRCSPLDGVLAINKALSSEYGYTEPLKEGFFGSRPPTRLSIKTGPNTETQAFAGMLAPPAWEGGYIAMNPVRPMAMQVQGVIKKKFEPAINRIMEDARRRVKIESIYRGQAVELDLSYLKLIELGQEYDPIAWAPVFLDISKPPVLILPRDIESELQTEIWGLIQCPDDFRFNKVPINYGGLLTGPKGTGKTLTAAHTAKVCVESGFSYFFLKTPQYFLEAYDMAQFYGPSVLFCEDVETIFGGPRNQKMNMILEKLDGVGSKGSEVVSIFTSNHPELINDFFLRGGRLGNEIKYRELDAESAARFIQTQSGEYLDPSIEMDHVGAAFNGLVPADVTEGVIKAKKLAIKQFGRNIKGRVTTQMLLDTGEVMRRLRGLQSKVQIPRDSFNLNIVRAGNAIVEGADIPMEAWSVLADYFHNNRTDMDKNRKEGPKGEKVASRPKALAQSAEAKG